ncbi:GYDIA family GHMP kinase [Psychroserpens sp. NJDZ02]|uniref:GYDIA family GHMP kinase n=1 Tax=Psychroserpens sp. NJDZ02 TaxID=2570561 RepID=UPI0010A7D574|nr:GYDIA family GHMP kinase [Psychroserpens sp. NJDZ02]QCE40708.1 GHMP kinase [Psychroserpens sp. NJDZ02]
MESFYSHGKLLLTGEYVVLDGAKALAIPTVFGQHLTIEPIQEQNIIWTSFDNENNIWFTDTITIEAITTSKDTGNAISNRLIQILNAAKQLNPEFLTKQDGFKITTTLEFPQDWGLGTSSTLINNLATWAKVDPYTLLERSFGGSGYDIACAQEDSALHYSLNNTLPKTELVDFKPIFSDQLYFVHLNKKQNSREGIAHYKSNRHNLTETIAAINQLTIAFTTCKSITAFQQLIEQHETLIARVTNQKTVKEILFSDFNGSIKSLGAWGGDFILVASTTNPTDYFKAKDYHTILKYTDMAL